jgi:hypothetical protein
VLGAAVVIGGKRAKLFTDGRPKVSWLNILPEFLTAFVLLIFPFQ